jgi:hypothetical protein
MNREQPGLQMIFSSQTQEAEHNALSFYLEDNLWGHLLELVNEYGKLEIYKENADQFLLHLGTHQFSIVKEFSKMSVNMLNVSTMSPGAAELLAKIANLVFFDRKRRLMILASNIDHEKSAWTACQKLEIPLKPADKMQAERFREWATAYQLNHRPQFKSFSESLRAHTNDSPTPGTKK